MVYRAEPQRDKLSVESGEQVQRLKHPTSKRLDVLSWLEQQDRCDVFLAVMLDFFACHRCLCLYIYQVEMICAGVLIVQIDHFLLDLYDEDTGTNHLHLVDIQAKTSVACEEIQHDSEEHITSILLFKPRKNIEPFACWVFESLYLFARFNRELIPLWLCSVDHRAYSCCYFQDDTWILASAYSHMASVRIHFPERLRL